jgi:periplasmic divalent cation tolerance protein
MMSMKTKIVVVSTTVDSEGEAGRLSGLIVAEKLAACVQYMTIHSTYRWKGRVVMNEECLLLSKTQASLAEQLVAFIKKNHSYEVPEITVTPIIGGYDGYLKWIASETRGATK